MQSFYLPSEGMFQVDGWAVGGTVTFVASEAGMGVQPGGVLGGVRLETPNGHHRQVKFIVQGFELALRQGTNTVQIAPAGQKPTYVEMQWTPPGWNKSALWKLLKIPVIVNGVAGTWYATQNDQTPRYRQRQVDWPTGAGNNVQFWQSPYFQPRTCLKVQVPNATGPVTAWQVPNPETRIPIPLDKLQQCVVDIPVFPNPPTPDANYSELEEVGGILLIVAGLALALVSKKTGARVGGVALTLVGGTVAAMGFTGESKK
jgi:hypothetical protein